jgi:uncharacterized protein (DUF302 family)
MTPSRGSQIIDIPSRHSVDETVAKLEGLLQAKGVTLFASVDHSSEAWIADYTRLPVRAIRP